MSIIVKGLDIPKDHSVIIEIDEYGEVCEHVKCDKVVHIKPWAKAIQIPKDHGNIKDDKVLAYMMDKELDRIANENESISKSARLSRIKALALKFDIAPSILEAEAER